MYMVLSLSQILRNSQDRKKIKSHQILCHRSINKSIIIEAGCLKIFQEVLDEMPKLKSGHSGGLS